MQGYINIIVVVLLEKKQNKKKKKITFQNRQLHLKLREAPSQAMPQVVSEINIFTHYVCRKLFNSFFRIKKHEKKKLFFLFFNFRYRY